MPCPGPDPGVRVNGDKRVGRPSPPLFASAKGGRGKRSETQGVHTPNTPIISSILKILQIRVQTTRLTSLQHMLYNNNQGRQTGRPLQEESPRRQGEHATLFDVAY